MKVGHKQIIALFLGLGFEPAAKWSVEKCNTKLASLLEIIDDPKQVSIDMLDDDETKQLFKEIKAAHKAEKSITVIADEAEEEDEKPAKKAAAADEDDEKPAKKKAAAADDDEDDAPAKPAKKAAKSDDDEDEKPAKKKVALADDDEDEKPAKKKAAASDDDEKPAKKAPKAASKVERNKFGSIIGNTNAKVDAALTGKFQTYTQIAEASGVERPRYLHLDGLVEAGFAEKGEVEGKSAWRLKSKKSA